MVIHVDDFLMSGQAPELEWAEAELSKSFSLKSQNLGGGPSCVQEAKFLNRTVRWTPEGLELEGDAKHLDILINEWNMAESKTYSTPGVKSPKAEANFEGKKGQEVAQEDMPKADATLFRRGVARIVYMSQDRMDLAFASKELARKMAQPKVGDEAALKRVIRYLHGRPRALYAYAWQEKPTALRVFTDSDWAGDIETRKSTSGGVILHGEHLLCHWSRTQATIALSSGEAELNASVKGASEALGLRTMAHEIGMKLKIDLMGDSSAAKGIMLRTGAGSIKHLCTKQLWIQERVLSKGIIPYKIKRDYNIADLCTHHWGLQEALPLFQAAGLVWRERGYHISEGGCEHAPIIIPITNPLTFWLKG